MRRAFAARPGSPGAGRFLCYTPGVPNQKLVDSDGNSITVTGTGALVTAPGAPAASLAADILVGRATADAATIITIPAGRTWQGSITLSGGLSSAAAAAAASATPTVSVAGTGVVPAAGILVGLSLRTGGGVATGTVGTNSQGVVCVPAVTVVAPAGNAVTVTLQTGGATLAAASAIGLLL